MNRTIWYGVKENDVRFSSNKTDLTEAGINNPQSFTVNGDVQGLNLIDEGQSQQSQSGGPQAHA